MSEKPEGTLEKRTRELLEESTSRLDGRTLSRLTQARHAALDRLQRPVRRAWWNWVPVGAAAAAAVLAVMMWSGNPKPEPMTVQNETQLDDLELLADADAPDFVDDGEDLEFYEWASSEVENEVES